MPKKSPAAEAAAASSLAETSRWLQPQLAELLRAAMVVLVVITPLVPSEAAVAFGSYATLAMLWTLLLALWGVSLLVEPQQAIRASKIDGLLAALIALIGISCMNATFTGNGRAAINSFWICASYAIAYWLAQQWFVTPVARRALVVVLIGAGMMQSSVGLSQFFVTMPRMRTEYKRNPERMLVDEGISTDPQSAQRKQFESRLDSVEPIGTFALTNSLAGMLLPVLLLGVALSLHDFRRFGTWRLLLFVALLALLVTCFLLTKSRTAWLAAIASAGIYVAMVLVSRRSTSSAGHLPDEAKNSLKPAENGPVQLGSQRTRLIWVAAAGVLLLSMLAGGVLWLGGLDAQVISEAPKSISYRLEYWLASSRMIADYPLLGAGPGNFQQTYANYKLPQSSEMIADPHNFVFEVAATCGLPAMLLLVVLLALLTYRAWSQLGSDERVPGSPFNESARAKSSVWWIYGGAIFATFAAWPMSLVAGYSLSLEANTGLPELWVVGLPVLVLTMVALNSWLGDGQLTIAMLLTACAALAINLLAAGAMTFPGVILPGVILLALLSNAPRVNAAPLISQAKGGGVMIAILVLLALCYFTQYQPVLTSRTLMSDAETSFLRQRNVERAAGEYMRAAAADRWSPEPWKQLARMWLEIAVRSDLRPEDFPRVVERFENASEQLRKANPRDVNWCQLRMESTLRLYDKTSDRRWLEEARTASGEAISRYPASARLHAQSAWIAHLLGDETAARTLALEAIRLDGLHDHREQKLANVRLFDVQASRMIFSKEESERTPLELMELLARTAGEPSS